MRRFPAIRRRRELDLSRNRNLHDGPSVGGLPLDALGTGPWSETGTRYIPQDVKIEVAARDQGRCRQCGSNRELHFDHIVAFSKGGANTAENIQLLCGACNRRKGAGDVEAELPQSPYREVWRNPAAPRPAPASGQPPPGALVSAEDWQPVCPTCGMLSALHTGSPCRG